jgi:RNA polymerase sigma factor for flagellar operon FliA
VQSGEGKQEPESHNLLLTMAPLVKRVAFQMRQHLPPHVEMDDLVGAGTLGLIDALRKFDSSRKVKVESYARHRIRGGILDALRTLDPATRDMRRRVTKVERTYHELEARLGRPVQDEEIARALGISLKVWHRWSREIHALGFGGWQRCETATSVGKLPMRKEGWMALPQEDPFDLCYRREQRDLVSRALAHLPRRERLIVTLYYQQDLTMKEIAARLDVDESRVSQLHAEALERLKARVRASLYPPKQVGLAVASRLASPPDKLSVSLRQLPGSGSLVL